MKTRGKIVKISPQQFEVLVGAEKVLANARGRIKLDRKIMLGDIVEIEDGIIINVLPQKNRLVRPECCNIDNFVILLASEPAPDFMLTDLLIALCFKQDINVFICINKEDINNKSFIDDIKSQYGKVVDVECVSAKTGAGIAELKTKLSDVTAFAGQSGVGKTSLLNALFGLNLTVGSLSEKIKRGQNTTSQSYFHVTSDGKIVVDTPGFSFLDITKLGLEPGEFKNSFLEFDEFSCKYPGCTHTGEPGCGINGAIKNRLISETRARRYQETYRKIAEAYKRRYD